MSERPRAQECPCTISTRRVVLCTVARTTRINSWPELRPRVIATLSSSDLSANALHSDSQTRSARRSRPLEGVGGSPRSHDGTKRPGQKDADDSFILKTQTQTYRALNLRGIRAFVVILIRATVGVWDSPRSHDGTKTPG